MAHKSKLTPQLPQMLTPRDAADRLRTTYSKILGMIRAGELKHLRLGKQYLIPESEIANLINSRLTTTWTSLRKTRPADEVHGASATPDSETQTLETQAVER